MLRRLLIMGSPALAAMSLLPGAASARRPCQIEHPNAETLQTADLLWTKLPGVPIPYAAKDKLHEGMEIDAATSPEAFERGRRAMYEELKAQPTLNDEAWRFKEALRTMSYEQFYLSYFNTTEPGRPEPYSSTTWLVGHVAIVSVDEDGDRHVVEAVQPKVHEMAYEDWSKKNEKQAVWHGRLHPAFANGLDASKKSRIVDEARRHLDAKYELFSRSATRLDDTKSFYCSKLVWHAVWQATGAAIDGNPKRFRPFWVSPKMLLSAKHVEKQADPGNYGSC